MQMQHESVDPQVFFYWHIEFKGCHYYALAFWASFVFGMVFRDPEVPSDEAKILDLTQ